MKSQEVYPIFFLGVKDLETNTDGKTEKVLVLSLPDEEFEPCRDRTYDPQIKSLLLSQLS